MGESLVSRVQRAIEKQGLLRAGERVGVAVSGGADSVALLLLLLELRKGLGVVLSVVHLNHKLRGKASEADEKFVAKLAARDSLAFHAEHADIKAKAKRDKANLEDAARRVRYEFFAEQIKKEHLDKIAVAHTADDQAETVLAHILRGTGLAGLGGIHPVAGHVIRPLLEFRRAELRAYLHGKKQPWREDASNRDIKRLRARIRKQLLPLLEKKFQAKIVQHLGTLADLAREDEAFLNVFAEARLNAVFAEAHLKVHADLNPDCAHISAGDLIDSGRTHSAIARRMVRLIVKKVKPASGQLGAEHVIAVLALAAHGENGKRLPLPGGLEVLRDHDALIFRRATRLQRSETARKVEFARTIDINRRGAHIPVPELSCVFRLKVIDWPAKRGETTKRESVLDRDALRSPLVLRNWRPGDRFQPLGHRNAHKLKRLLNREHIDGAQREGWPVLTSGDVLAWVRGFPVGAEFAASEGTRTGIVIAEERIL